MARAAAVELTALEHLHELMQRVLWSVGFMIAGGALSYIFRLQIIEYLQHPLHQELYYTSPMGSFQFVMQVCLLCGLLCALPVLLYNVLRFIEPAFDRKFTRKTVVTILSASLFLTVAGAAFAYYVTLPAALRFFNTVGTNDLHALISVNEYFGFIMGYLATFAIVFQLPLVLLFIDHIKPFSPGGLSSKRKFVYVGSFAISLIMPSSPDPLSQVSLAIPIITLYELSIVLIWWSHRKQARKAAKRLAKATESSSYVDAITDEADDTPTFDFATAVPIMAGGSPAGSAAVMTIPVASSGRPVRAGRVRDIARPRATVPRTNYQAMPTTKVRGQKPRIISDIM